MLSRSTFHNEQCCSQDVYLADFIWKLSVFFSDLGSQSLSASVLDSLGQLGGPSGGLSHAGQGEGEKCGKKREYFKISLPLR